jgi:hypothetical protein
VYQSKAQHPLSDKQYPLPDSVGDAMWELFVAIGKHWGTVTEPGPYRSRLESFMENRIALMPLYADYYAIARRVIDDLLKKHGGVATAAYEELFTSKEAAKQPPTTPLALTRQAVANEFVSLHVALGGFQTYGAQNVPGYFGGANVPGRPAPYRTMNQSHDR